MKSSRERIRGARLLNLEECSRLRLAVLRAKRRWTTRVYDKRHPEWAFFTLGAASYLDAAQDGFPVYRKKAGRDNPFLRKRFAWLYERLRLRLERLLKEPAHYDEELALPGFHIFTHPADKSRHPHYDRQYEFIKWNKR